MMSPLQPVILLSRLYIFLQWAKVIANFSSQWIERQIPKQKKLEPDLEYIKVPIPFFIDQTGTACHA